MVKLNASAEKQRKKTNEQTKEITQTTWAEKGEEEKEEELETFGGELVFHNERRSKFEQSNQRNSVV